MEYKPSLYTHLTVMWVHVGPFYPVVSCPDWWVTQKNKKLHMATKLRPKFNIPISSFGPCTFSGHHPPLKTKANESRLDHYILT